MKNLLCITILFCLLFCVKVLSIDLINSTCKQCAKESTILSYEFCSKPLQAIPISHITNLQGLALIAMELALENATGTISILEKMMYNREFDHFALLRLEDCLQLYEEAVPILASVIEVFLEEQYNDVNLLVSTVMDTSSTCEAGFEEREGEISPLTEENHYLLQLGDVAICIINLASLALRSDNVAS